jgi:hypothetical protein
MDFMKTFKAEANNWTMIIRTIMISHAFQNGDDGLIEHLKVLNFHVPVYTTAGSISLIREAYMLREHHSNFFASLLLIDIGSITNMASVAAIKAGSLMASPNLQKCVTPSKTYQNLIFLLPFLAIADGMLRHTGVIREQEGILKRKKTCRRL